MGKPIVVFGSFVVDLTGWAEDLPLPGQTILGRKFKMGAGGKGSNQAVAAYRAGADVTLVTKLGRDVLADVGINFYHDEGMNTKYILRDDVNETGVALIIVSDKTAQNEIAVIPGACNNITVENVESCRRLIETASILLLQHEINLDAQRMIIDIADRAGVRIVLNPAPAVKIPDDILAKIDTVTPNETEAQVLTGIEVVSFETARKAADFFLEKGVKNVVITMGSMGVFAADGEQCELFPALKVHAVDTTGAGDAFNGGFVTALSENKTLFEAVRFGNVAGALSVTGTGTAPAMPYREKIDEMIRQTY